MEKRLSTSFVPGSYEEWVHCITVECGLKLDPSYIQTRIAALNDPRQEHTRQFTRLYGDAHRERVIQWFQLSLKEAE